MVKSTSILLILAMVGTGFGQTTSIRQKTGFSCNLAGTTATATWACNLTMPGIYGPPEAVCFCEADQVITPAAVPKWVAGRAPEGVDERVDVPAIQEDIDVGTAECHYDKSQAGLLCKRVTRPLWSCADPNRALLTSVNGKRHSCHLIQEDK